MPRPSIVRADTIDLQDRSAPSAKDHSRQPEHPSTLSNGAPAPHQAAAVRNVKKERTAEQEHLSHSWGAVQSVLDESDSDNDGAVDEVGGPNGEHHYQTNGNGTHQNGDVSASAEGGEGADGESDDNLEDDMMDKISSSPSIDDGGYTSHSAWPARSSSLTPSSTPTRASFKNMSSSELDSSSPFTSTPSHFPLFYEQAPVATSATALSEPASLSSESSSSLSSRSSAVKVQDTPSQHHHLEGEYLRAANREDSVDGSQESYEEEDEDDTSDLSLDEQMLQASEDHGRRPAGRFKEHIDDDLKDLLLPVDDPLLEYSLEDDGGLVDDASDSGSWETESGDESDWDEDDLKTDDDDVFFSPDARFVDSGWGGECLREIEDIDFEFVYALHTFVATVEGQANATKGDTMVLLDDSNSYWWLVRVVKDSSIGYLPAEHIETPTERLARLNKHRNIDLSATMLGDNAEKSKNPLKKAMRRRNAKTVQFSAPTYVEASDYDYTTDEDREDDQSYANGDSEAEEGTGQETTTAETDEIAPVEPLRVNGVKREAEEVVSDEASSEARDETNRESAEKPRASDDSSEIHFEMTAGKSRNGTVRNTDSFFKDDTVETRKITLTPNLLRDDSSTGSTPRNSESQARSGSLDGYDKGSQERPKDDKKRKEKKPGMLSGLFKRKDKKAKHNEDDGMPETEKTSAEISRNSPQPKSSAELSPTEPTSQAEGSPRRHSSKGKLQKSPKLDTSNTKIPQGSEKETPESESPRTPLRASSTSNIRTVQQDADDTADAPPANGVRSLDASIQSSQRLDADEAARGPSEEPSEFASSTISVQGSASEALEKARQRAPLDDFSPSPIENKANPFADSSNYKHPKDYAAERRNTHSQVEDRLSESPVEISSSDVSEPQRTPISAGDGSSQEDLGVSPISSSSSPSLIDAPPPGPPPTAAPPPPPITATTPSSSSSSTPTQATKPILFDGTTTAAVSSSPSPSSYQSTSDASAGGPPTPQWSDACLRSYLDDSSDIRDLLLVVHDKSGVVPVGPDHPLMAGLFQAERGLVLEMGHRLDGLLEDWLTRKFDKSRAKAAKT